MDVIRAIGEVKKHARQDTWCSTHANCFKCSIGKGESMSHIMMKFQQFLEWRKFGATVYTELRWKNGTRSDLVVVLNNGETFIVEVVESESEQSLLEKSTKYPFPIKVVRNKILVLDNEKNKSD